ncbi:hypothetical protein CJ307_35025, partial [Klebsiella quasipneumoniae]
MPISNRRRRRHFGAFANAGQHRACPPSALLSTTPWRQSAAAGPRRCRYRTGGGGAILAPSPTPDSIVH